MSSVAGLCVAVRVEDLGVKNEIFHRLDDFFGVTPADRFFHGVVCLSCVLPARGSVAATATTQSMKTSC
jgi:hypothetical protein